MKSELENRIFKKPRYVKYYEYTYIGDDHEAYYFDTVSKNIYIIKKPKRETSECSIQELTKSSDGYYEEFYHYTRRMKIENDYKLTFVSEVDVTVKANSPEEAKEMARRIIDSNFASNITKTHFFKLKTILGEDGNKVFEDSEDNKNRK